MPTPRVLATAAALSPSCVGLVESAVFQFVTKVIPPIANITRMLWLVSGDERLQSRQVGGGVFFVIDLNAYAQGFGHSGGVEPQLRRIGGERRVPVRHKGNPANRQHYAYVVAGEIADDLRIHSDGHAVYSLRVVGLVAHDD